MRTRRSRLRPPPKLTVSEWSDTYRRLSPEASAEPGRWITARAEYQRGIMDAISDPAIHTVVVMSSAQVGKTEALLNVIGYHVHQDPAPILLLQPTLEMAQAFSKDRLAPMLRDTPALKGLVKDARARDSGNTLLHKTYPGGHITLAGSNSPASLASRPVRVVLCDEVDRFPASAGTEGDPVSLARKRAATFWNRSVLLTSTPTVAGASRIEREWQESDMRRFYVPCPHCGDRQHLQWAQVQWPEDRPDEAAYCCEHCGALWTDAERWRAIRQGEWRAEGECTGTAGFHLNEIYSPWTQLADIASAFLAAKRGGPDQLKTWVNTSLGECWEEDEGEGADWQDLYRRREHYPAEVPENVSVIVAGVDTQDDRLEAEIVGWGEGEESWGLDYVRLYGDPGQPQLWRSLRERLRRTFQRSDGLMLNVRLVCIDSGGHYTDEVYDWCQQQGRTWAVPIQGASVPGKPIAAFPRKPNRRGVYLTTVGTDTAKELIYGRYQMLEPGPGYCHWPVSDAYDEPYFQQATAEKRVRKYRAGVPYYVWDAGKRRTEALDCRVYALAAVRILQQHMGVRLEAPARPQPKAASPAKKPSRRGGWIHNYDGNWL